MPIIDVKIPDIGDFKGIPIVEVFVNDSLSWMVMVVLITQFTLLI